MRKGRGSLFVVSAPSGAGKTTLCKKLVLSMDGLEFSVSYTTRQPRPGEVDGDDYSFVSKDRFKEMVSGGEFMEWAEVHGSLYGTSRSRLEKTLAGGTDVIMDVDVQGARQIRKAYHGGIYVFILPPSREALRERLQKRKNNTPEEISQRLKAAADEIREIRDYSAYDYVIINDVFEVALKKLEAIVVSRRVISDSIDQSWVEEIFLKQEDV